jgi:hypothetical protein
LPQVLYRGARAASRGASTLPQQEKHNSADVQRIRVNITGCLVYSSLYSPFAKKVSRRTAHGH